MRFRGKQEFGEPGSIIDILSMAKLDKFSDDLLNKRCFKWTKCEFFVGNMKCIYSTNFALIVLDRTGLAFLAEDLPELFDT